MAWLRDAAARARAGQPSAVLVHGEPGVGKTRVVTEVADELGREGFRVLWGRCVRFAAEASSYLPIAQALGPRLELNGAAVGGSVLHRVRTALDELMATGPVALIVDDVHWADVSSLDVLTYLAAGFADGQPLLVLGAYRDTELGAGHPLHGWLADMRRMPGVALLPLRRFDRHDTGLLVHALLGADHRASLVEQCYDRSDGNAYLVELLVQELEPAAESLSAVLPGDLREALLAAWHRLSPPARGLMQVLAVGGRPVDVGVLDQVAEAVGAAHGARVAVGVAESIDAGLAVLCGDGSVWFQHPLVAEVLVSTVLPPEAARLHAEYVAVWLAAESAPARLRAAHLALHHEASADASAALTWSLRAAAEAERVRGFGEESHHLSAACRLWPLADARRRRNAGAYVDLLLRATRAAHRAGDLDTALSLGRRAYELTKDDEDPLVCCRVLIELNILRQLHGRRPSLATLREAVGMSSAFPSSPEHVRSLAEVASHEQRLGMPEAAEHAEEALEAARACGSVEALAHALIGAADARCGQQEALAFAAEAMQLSRQVGEPLFISNSAIAWANCLLTCGRGPEAGPFLLEVYGELVRAGAPHEAGKMAVEAAMHLLVFGEWGRCRDLLREAMAIRMAPFFARNARLVAASLAVRCGDLPAALMHLHRAEELAAAGAGGLDDWYISAAVDVRVARGRFRDGVALITQEITAVVRYDPAFADELMATAAAATTNMVEHWPAQRREAIARLDELEHIRGAVQPAMSAGLVPGDPVPAAFGALYTAHRSRLAVAPVPPFVRHTAWRPTWAPSPSARTWRR